jgi:hypothetical protein
VPSRTCAGESESFQKLVKIQIERLSNCFQRPDAWWEQPLYTFKQAGKVRFQPLGNSFDIHQRDVSYSALDSAVIGPMQSASLRSLLLNDALFLADATDCTAKPDANIERH